MKKPEFTGKLEFAIEGVGADKAKRHWREVLSGDILRESNPTLPLAVDPS